MNIITAVATTAMRNRPNTSRWLRALAESGTFFRITGIAATSSSDTRNMAVHDT